MERSRAEKGQVQPPKHTVEPAVRAAVARLLRIISSDVDILKYEVVKTIFRSGILLNYFGEEKVSLEDVYRKSVDMEAK